MFELLDVVGPVLGKLGTLDGGEEMDGGPFMDADRVGAAAVVVEPLMISVEEVFGGNAVFGGEDVDEELGFDGVLFFFGDKAEAGLEGLLDGVAVLSVVDMPAASAEIYF